MPSWCNTTTDVSAHAFFLLPCRGELCPVQDTAAALRGPSATRSSPRPAWNPPTHHGCLLAQNSVQSVMEDWRPDWEKLRTDYGLAHEFQGHTCNQDGAGRSHLAPIHGGADWAFSMQPDHGGSGWACRMGPELTTPVACMAAGWARPRQPAWVHCWAQSWPTPA
jgi:hypothetical protein